MRALALAILSLSLLLPLSACEAPAGAAVVKCTGELTLGYPERNCTITVAQLKGSAGKTFEGKKRHRHAKVSGDFTVKQGSVKVLLRGSGAAKEFTLTPDAPLHLEEDLRLQLNKRAFSISFQSESATGVAGDLHYVVR